MSQQQDSAPALAAMSAAIVLDRVTVSFGGLPLFDHFSAAFPAGEWTCVLGASGSGKSTLLRRIAGLGPAGTGAVSDGRAALAGRIAWMDQRDLLLPWRSALGNVLLGGRLRREPADVDRARELLAAVELPGRENARPAQLSGGMRQRVALARTLMEDRAVVLMDEPFSAVDALTRARLQTLAASLLAGRTVILVTHDPMEALRLGHGIHVLSGRPATLDDPLRPPGPPPRDQADPALLALYRELMARLEAAA